METSIPDLGILAQMIQPIIVQIQKNLMLFQTPDTNPENAVWSTHDRILAPRFLVRAVYSYDIGTLGRRVAPGIMAPNSGSSRTILTAYQVMTGKRKAGLARRV